MHTPHDHPHHRYPQCASQQLQTPKMEGMRLGSRRHHTLDQPSSCRRTHQRILHPITEPTLCESCPDRQPRGFIRGITRRIHSRIRLGHHPCLPAGPLVTHGNTGSGGIPDSHGRRPSIPSQRSRQPRHLRATGAAAPACRRLLLNALQPCWPFHFSPFLYQCISRTPTNLPPALGLQIRKTNEIDLNRRRPRHHRVIHGNAPELAVFSVARGARSSHH